MVVADVLQNMRIGFVYLHESSVRHDEYSYVTFKVFISGDGVKLLGIDKNGYNYSLHVDSFYGYQSFDINGKFHKINMPKIRKISILQNQLDVDFELYGREDFLNDKEKYGTKYTYI